MIVGLIALGAAILFYMNHKNEEERFATGASGFDVRSTASTPPTQEPGRSGLGMVELPDDSESATAIGASPGAAPETDRNGRSVPAPNAAEERQAGPVSLKEAARKSGAGVSAYTANFKKTHPIMAEYSRAWLSHPDLKKLNDDYMRERDPVKFLHGLAAAPSLGPFIMKVATDPAAQATLVEFLSGVTKAAPADLTEAATAVLKDDSIVRTLAANVAQSIGLPPSMLSSLTGGAIPSAPAGPP